MKKLNFSEILMFFYVILTSSISNAISLTILQKSILALPSIIIIPFLVGSLFHKTLFKNLIKKDRCLVLIFKRWSIGTIFLITLALLLNFLTIFRINYFILIILVLMLINIIIKDEPTPYNETKEKNIVNKENLILTILLLFSLTFAIFISILMPYPLFYGSDMFRHNQNVLRVIESNNFHLEIPYLPTFNIIITTVVKLYDIYPESFAIFWSSRFLLYPLYSIIIYFLVFSISDNKIISFLSGIAVITIDVESNNIWNLTPKIIIYLLFPLVLYTIKKELSKEKIELHKSKKNFAIMLIITCLFSAILFFILNYTYAIFREMIGIILAAYLLIVFCIAKIKIFNHETINNLFLTLIICFFISLLIHTSMGAVLIFISLIFVSVILLKDEKYYKIFYYILAIMLILYVLSQITGILSFPKIDFYNDAPNVIKVDFWSKYNLLIKTTNLISPFLIIGIIFLLLKGKNLLNLLFFITLFIYFLPIIGIERIISFLPPIVVLISGYGILYLQDSISKKKLKITLYSLIIIILITANISSLLIKTEPLRNKQNNTYSHFNYKEYLIFEWIKNNTSKNTLIISDPYTDAMVAGLSNRNNFPLLMRSNYYPEEYPQKAEINRILLNENPEATYDDLNKIIRDPEFTCEQFYINPKRCNINLSYNIIIIFNAKTFNWIDSKKLNKDILSKFYNSTYFTELYFDNSNKIYIFGVNPEPGVEFKNQ